MKVYNSGALRLSPLAGRGRIASAIRVRGALRKGGGNGLKNASDIAQHVVVPEPQDAIVAIGEPFIPGGIAGALYVLPSVDLNNEPTFAADEVDGVRSYRLLPDELVSIQPTGAKAVPKHPFRICRRASQAPRTLGLEVISTAHAALPPHPACYARRPLPASGERLSLFALP